MPYLHGAYGELGASIGPLVPSGVATLPVYIGRAPVHQLRDTTGLVNRPILISSYDDAVRKIGYADNWEDFELCEAVYAHFKNAIGPIGPIVVINVLDPDTMASANTTSASVDLLNNQGVIDDDELIISTLEISSKTWGVDFSASYTPDGKKVILRDLKGTLTSPVTVTYKKVTPESVTATEIVGQVTDDERTGIQAVAYVYQDINQIPTILAAPGWSDTKAVRDALVAACQRINGHWYAFAFTDIPANSTTDTISKAKTWKASNGYTSEFESPCWPLAVNGNRLFHMSTLAVVTTQRAHYLNDNIPSDTASNKLVDITGLAIDDGTGAKIISQDQEQANQLNAEGIKTAIFWGGQWRIWGGHTGAYKYGSDNDPRNIFDSSVMMLSYVLNTFQKTNGPDVDVPLTRQLIDTKLNSFQEWLDNLIAKGALLSGNIRFYPVSNPTSDMIEGNFRFDITATTAPQAKSITGVVAYTAEGLAALWGGETA